MKRVFFLFVFALAWFSTVAQEVSKNDAALCRHYFRDSVRMHIDVIAADQLLREISSINRHDIGESFS